MAARAPQESGSRSRSSAPGTSGAAAIARSPLPGAVSVASPSPWTSCSPRRSPSGGSRSCSRPGGWSRALAPRRLGDRDRAAAGPRPQPSGPSRSKVDGTVPSTRSAYRPSNRRSTSSTPVLPAIAILGVLSVASLLLRFRRSRAFERQQLHWFLSRPRHSRQPGRAVATGGDGMFLVALIAAAGIPIARGSPSSATGCTTSTGSSAARSGRRYHGRPGGGVRRGVVTSRPCSPR